MNEDDSRERYAGILELDNLATDGIFCYPPDDGLEVDIGGIIKYAESKYGGAIKLMTPEEFEQFITRPEKAQETRAYPKKQERRERKAA